MAAESLSCSQESSPDWGRWVVYGLGGLSLAVAAAPIVLPFLGVGGADLPPGLRPEDMAATICSTGEATGLAGWSAGLLENIPLVGDSLAKGGLMNAAVAGGIALGGMLLGNKMEEHQKDHAFPWHKVVKAVTLATTMLVALPAILPAITMGITYLAMLAGEVTGQGINAYGEAISWAQQTFGKLGADSAASLAGGGVSLGVLAGSHLLSCGVAVGAGSAALGHKAHKAHKAKRACADEFILGEPTLRLQAHTASLQGELDRWHAVTGTFTERLEVERQQSTAYAASV